MRFALTGLVVAAGVMVAAPAAMGAATAAPAITMQPSNPNTTQGTVRFEYQVGAGETSVVTPLRFYCRQYLTSSPPAPTAGWVACGTTAGAPPYFRTYAPANGSQTFDVAVRESTNISTQGPIASYVWSQNLPAPAQPPALTATPANPNTSSPNDVFSFTGGTGEVGLPNLYQCSLDGAAFIQCNSGTITYSVANGPHTVQIKAGTATGYGPVAEYNWTKNVPNPDPSIKVGAGANTVYTGGAANAALGKSLENVGDINGDGVDDLGMNSGGATNPGLYIQFTSPSGRGTTSVANTPASYGYRIAPTAGTVTAYNLGDWNGDGTPDQFVTYGAGASNYVVYGVEDPSTLPICASGAPARCLDPATMTSSQGYQLNDSEAIGIGTEDQVATLDFNGDGSRELVLSAASVDEILVIKAGARVGPVDLATLPATDMLTLTNVNGFGGNTTINRVADINADGKDDLSLAFGPARPAGGSEILYGINWTDATYDLGTFTPSMGVTLATPAISASSAYNTGDLNGDGRDDLTVGVQGFLDPNGGIQSFLYLPAPGTAGAIVTGFDLEPGTGYYALGGSLASGIGKRTVPIGDFNGDGLDDTFISASATPVDGVTGVGAGYVVFGQASAPENLELGLGPDLTPEAGIALLGSGANVGSGDMITSLGDIDGDGLTDLAYAASGADPDAVNNAGTVSIVPGKALINQAKTGNAVGVTNETASLNGSVATNGRDSEAYFEYGTSDEYGETTATQELEASGSGSPVDAGLTGLTKGTEYHYRVVATNDLGVKRYGADRTFTTTDAPIEPGPSPCIADPSLPGCSGYCDANPTKMGCPDYDWCAANPGKCTGGPAKLATLVASPKSLKVKRGKKGTITAIVTNAGGETASGVKVCVKAPKKFVKVKGCQTVGSLASGSTKVLKFKVTVKKQAKKGKKISLNFTASGSGVDSKKATAKITVG
ncbi:MAG TPA: fibronectin type III domain-containing protein [Solirubrobacterales bacterium]|nr:fibronectin type III domain-containing protein [Solirubrobacterales bacterium]